MPMEPTTIPLALYNATRRHPPTVAVVLGSGMGSVAKNLRPFLSLGFDELGLSHTSVVGHAGRLLLGEWAGKVVLVFQGRLHYYEGHSWDGVARPVNLAADLGVNTLVLTNAAGGIRDDLDPGSLMAIRDHLPWTRPGAWARPGPGARPSPYSTRLLGLWQEAAREIATTVPEGVYGAVTGPSYETPAEIRALRSAGADAVGMSTAHEIETGRSRGLECAAVSCITNRAAGLAGKPLDHHEVLATAATQGERLVSLLEAFLRRI
jgi:purine-nucleoside phosphorylase